MSEQSEWPQQKHFSHFKFSLHTNLTLDFDPKQGRGFEVHLNIQLKIHKYANFRGNPTKGDFLYITPVVLLNPHLVKHVHILVIH